MCKHELSNPACWSSFDVTALTEFKQAFVGAIFDGRYVQYVNSTDDQLRFDSQADFSTSASWSTFDLSKISFGFAGGAFDGRYAYVTPTLPANNGAAMMNYDAIAARYDTQAAFGASGSWSSFNVTRATGSADLTVPGFSGSAFDGRYVYFAPGYIGVLPSVNPDQEVASGNVSRYDSQAPFELASSWSSFDLTKVAATAAGYSGAVFDGRYLYLMPHETEHALAARYDTQADFATAGSWSTFETTTLNQYAGGFTGGIFDGRYVYFLPGRAQTAFPSVVTRYDTQASFSTASSWAVFDTTALGATSFSTWLYSGGAFDGRYVYLIPPNGDPLLRYDTQGSFGSTQAWESVDLFRVSDGATGFRGGAFDGRYLYLVPDGYNSAVRFDAGNNGTVPTSTHGSFF